MLGLDVWYETKDKGQKWKIIDHVCVPIDWRVRIATGLKMGQGVPETLISSPQAHYFV